MMGGRTTARTAPDARFRGPDDRGTGTRPDRFAALPHDVAGLPPLSTEFWAALDRGLRALELAVPDDARAAIDGHIRMLLAWNAAINLTSVVEPVAAATRHVLDSLTAMALIVPGDVAGRAPGEPGQAPGEPGHAPGEPGRAPGEPGHAPGEVRGAVRSGRGATFPAIIDLGSGGGFPGLPLAAAIPGSRVTLVESVAKKARFLEAVVAATGLGDRVTVRAARAEALPGRGSWDVVTARAVGSLAELVELALPLLRIQGRLLAWKRGELEEELRAGNRAAARLGGTPAVVHRIDSIPGLEGHLIVVITKLGPTPSGYPRDPARRARQPW